MALRPALFQRGRAHGRAVRKVGHTRPGNLRDASRSAVRRPSSSTVVDGHGQKVLRRPCDTASPSRWARCSPAGAHSSAPKSCRPCHRRTRRCALRCAGRPGAPLVSGAGGAHDKDGCARWAALAPTTATSGSVKTMDRGCGACSSALHRPVRSCRQCGLRRRLRAARGGRH